MASRLPSENAVVSPPLQRAEKTLRINKENLNQTFHRLRQSDIDEELFMS